MKDLELFRRLLRKHPNYDSAFIAIALHFIKHLPKEQRYSTRHLRIIEFIELNFVRDEHFLILVALNGN